MPVYTDTHTHLYDDAFAEDFRETVARAAEAGVTRLVFPDIDSSSRERMLSCADMFPGTVFCTAGLHPTSVGKDWKEELEAVSAALGCGRRWYGIGEIGMDCYWSREFVAQQKEAFDAQLSWAAGMGLPVIIHSREATLEIEDVLENYRGRGLRGVFHAFSGSIETFRKLEKYGDFMAGIGGVLTYRKSRLPETAAAIGLSRILLETDSPYLTPVPKRGTRNESSYIPYVAARLAEATGTDTGQVAMQTTANAAALFGLDQDQLHKH